MNFTHTVNCEKISSHAWEKVLYYSPWAKYIPIRATIGNMVHQRWKANSGPVREGFL
jgi:hypothetical protein